ncbi:MAG: SH3 domain-containing protein, partial [Mesorhizobium sp.]
DEFRFTREGSLNMIRVGVSERFEITDQLALGN